MNVWNFTGNVGKADMRYLPSGESILAFSVAVSSGYGDKKQTTWANCSLFGKRAESLQQYIQKGQTVGVSGEVTLRPWTDKEGQQRHNLEVRVNDLTLLGSRPSETSASAVPQSGSDGQEPGGSAMNGDFDDDIPF
jgi:single-strand DNA-binding protein